MRHAGWILAAILLAGLAYLWQPNPRVDEERAAFTRRIDSLTADSHHWRGVADSLTTLAERLRYTADSFRNVSPETLAHEAERALDGAGLDSLRAVLLARP